MNPSRTTPVQMRKVDWISFIIKGSYGLMTMRFSEASSFNVVWFTDVDDKTVRELVLSVDVTRSAFPMVGIMESVTGFRFELEPEHRGPTTFVWVRGEKLPDQEPDSQERSVPKPSVTCPFCLSPFDITVEIIPPSKHVVSTCGCGMVFTLSDSDDVWTDKAGLENFGVKDVKILENFDTFSDEETARVSAVCWKL